MRLFLLVLTAVIMVALPRGARAQDRDVRFAITHVGDTTVTFEAGKMTWIVRAPRAIVVDPRRRDALVAQLKVLSIGANGEATALVTARGGRCGVLDQRGRVRCELLDRYGASTAAAAPSMPCRMVMNDGTRR